MKGKRRRKIAVMTGTRAEYGLLKGIMKRIHEDRCLALSTIVTGTHLSRDFGYTVDEIARDGFNIASKLDILSGDDSGLGMALFISRAVNRIAASLAKIRPDILLVLGDRPEVLAAALAATYLNVPIAHVHGGDVSGSVDHPVRYAISKLCHIHFVATPKAASRLRHIGEEKKRIFVVGAPGLDDIIQGSYTAAKDLERKYEIDSRKPLLLLVQHPVVTERRDAAHQMIQTLEALKTLGFQTLIIYPNSDAGGRAMIKEIIKYSRKYSFLKPVPSIPRRDYLGIMSAADVIVGNSSSAIIEAPSFGLPAVNIGSRQLGRERARDVLDVGHDKKSIARAVRSVLANSRFHMGIAGTRHPYGNGRASKRIARHLRNINLGRYWPKR